MAVPKRAVLLPSGEARAADKRPTMLNDRGTQLLMLIEVQRKCICRGAQEMTWGDVLAVKA